MANSKYVISFIGVWVLSPKYKAKTFNFPKSCTHCFMISNVRLKLWLLNLRLILLLIWQGWSDSWWCRCFSSQFAQWCWRSWSQRKHVGSADYICWWGGIPYSLKYNHLILVIWQYHKTTLLFCVTASLRSHILTFVNVIVSWDVTLCGSGYKYQHFGWYCCLHICGADVGCLPSTCISFPILIVWK